jgi:nucleotide-binding universal stress UspA family protein
MWPPKHILVPVDYSESSKAIVPYINDMLAHFPADLTLVHACGPGALAYSELALTDPRLLEDVGKIEEKRLRTFASDTFPGLKVETVTAIGEAGAVVHDTLRNRGSDLVMLATHGHGPVRRLLLGSITTKILHDVDCAVWTATGAAIAGHPSGIPYRSVLCAIDEREESEAALRAGAAIAGAYGASLSLVHVLETPIVTGETNYAEIRAAMLNAAEVRIRELKSLVGTNAPHAVLEGGVAESIHEEALRRKADLIVTGRGRIHGAVSRLWAHLYAIVRDAPCPVLSV